jgi:hypothetical protein
LKTDGEGWWWYYLYALLVKVPVGTLLLGVLTFNPATSVALYPLVLGGVSIVASVIATFAVRSRAGNVERALYQGLIVSALLSAAAFYPVTQWLMDDFTYREVQTHLNPPGVGRLYLCSLIGIGVTAGLFVITDYYTSTRFRPVRTTARASQTGHATNIIQGLAQGFQSTAAPAILLALGILVANELAGIYGIGVAVMAQLSLTGLIVALDAFGPITDNAGGIAEMADLPEDVRNVTDPLDAVGNTTKAVTKGYAIGSAALAALVLFAAFVEELREEAATERASVVLADTQPPTVAIQQDTPLTQGAWVSGPQQLNYTASDNVGVQRARALLNGQEAAVHGRDCLLVSPAGPFSALQPCPNGPGQMVIRADRLAAEGTRQLIVEAQEEEEADVTLKTEERDEGDIERVYVTVDEKPWPVGTFYFEDSRFEQLKTLPPESVILHINL